MSEFVTSTFVRQNRYQRLLEIAGLISGSLNPKVVWRRATEAAAEIASTEAASLFLVDEATGELVVEVAFGSPEAEFEKIRIPKGEGIVGHVVKNGKTVIIDDVEQDNQFETKVDYFSDFVTRNLMCAPLIHRGKVIGALEVANKFGDMKFTNNDQLAFEALANQVAVSIVNARYFDELQRAFLGTISALVETIEKRDPYTGGHTKRVLEGSLAIASRMGLDEQDMERLRMAAMLHDIGKLGVDDAILRKAGKLSDEEFDMMRRHTQFGEEIVEHVPGMIDVIPGILHHHERYDGKGYPGKLKGQGIPLMARIICVADTYDAMTSNRPYRKGLPHETAVKELRDNSGTQFDPLVVQAFFEAMDSGEFLGTQQEEDF